MPEQSQLGLLLVTPDTDMTKPAIFSPGGQHEQGKPVGSDAEPEPSPDADPDSPELPFPE